MSKFSHECDEWDGLRIDENDMEFVACGCFDDPEAKAAGERQSDKLLILNLTADNKRLREMVAKYVHLAACDDGELWLNNNPEPTAPKPPTAPLSEVKE